MSLPTRQSCSRGSSKCCLEIERQRTRYRSRKSAETRQHCTTKAPRSGTTMCSTTPANALTYVRAGALVPVSSCLDGGATRVGPSQYPQYTREPTKGGCGLLATPRPQSTTSTTNSEPNTPQKTHESRKKAQKGQRVRSALHNVWSHTHTPSGCNRQGCEKRKTPHRACAEKSALFCTSCEKTCICKKPSTHLSRAENGAPESAQICTSCV